MEKISEVLIESTGQTVKLEGEKGTTFTPSVDANGNLSWTNDGGKQNPTTVNIKGERGEKGDTTVIDPSTATVYTLYNQKGNHTDGAMTQAAVTEEFEKLDENYARNDGYYESMGVGTASNLKGQNVVDAEFAYRKSGGNVEVQDGNAMIEAIKGNTLAWNQFADGVSVTGTNASVSNKTTNGFTLTAPASSAEKKAVQESLFVNKDHIYYYGYDYTSTLAFSIQDMNSGSGSKPAASTFSHVSKIGKVVSSSYSSLYWYLYAATSQAWTLVVKNYIVVDLTLIYGSGNEPSTPEQFEQDYFNWFGKPLTYEPYDAGSLRNTKVSGLKTVGFNQYDEIWEDGVLNTQGQEVADNNYIRTKHYSPIISGQDYYFNMPNSLFNATNGLYLFLYDESKTFLRVYLVNYKNNLTRVVNIKAAYIKICIPKSSYSSAYNHDICINLSDPNRNGEYEPYKESTLPLDVTTLTGKLNGEGSSVVVFADGMNSVGDVHDEIKIGNGVVKAIKRVGKVDLGTLNWWFSTVRGSLWFVGLPNLKQISSSHITPNVITSIYSTTSYYTKPDKSISQYYHTNELCIYDSSYVSNDTPIQPHLQGVMLYYELEEPEVYVLDDFNLPKLYPVANGGTEEQLSNAQNSLPATLSIRYGLNAAAFIQNAPKNYISKESMSNFLGNLGSAMGGTWSMVWNSSTNKYDFSFSQNRSVENVEQPIEDK